MAIVAGLIAGVLGLTAVRQRAGAWMLVLAADLGCVGCGSRPRDPDAPAGHAAAGAAGSRCSMSSSIGRLSTVPLFTGAFADDPEGGGYGLLEQWIPRVGNYTSRRGRAIRPLRVTPWS